MPEQPETLFVGRDRELDELLRGLDDAMAGHGRLYLVAGEPGIGKSRLADELAARARARGQHVLWGRGWEDAGAPPYWMWVQAIRSYLRAAATDDVRQQLGARATEIAQMVPDVRELVPDLPAAVDVESESARFRLFDSTTTFLHNAARSTPLVIILDDLQAADTPSLLFLQFFASQLADAAILTVGTYRDVELTDDHPLRKTVAELRREPTTRVLELAGLGEHAVGRFIQETAGLPPRAQLVATMCRETGGNPLFVGEAMRLLVAEGRLDEVAAGQLHLPVPAGIRDVIDRRLRHLDPATIEVLTAGAVLGPEFSIDVLRRIGEFPAADPLEAIDDAARAGLIVPARGSVGRFRFAHDLVRETLYDQLATGKRAALHRRVAEILEQIHSTAIDEHLAELAHHYFEAAQVGELDSAFGYIRRAADQAASYARRAADSAARSLAFEEAARLYSMALAVLDAHTSADETPRLEILLALGDVQARAGDLRAGRASFSKAAAIARRTGNAPALARAALGYGGRFVWARAGDDTAMIPLLQEALVMLGGAEDRLRVRLLTRLACAWRGSAQHREQSDALSQQAVELARQLDDPVTLCFALVGRYGAIYWPETAHERLPIAQEHLAVSEAAADPERMIDAHMTLAFTYADLGRMTEAWAEIDHLTRLADELRQPAQLWLAIATRASFSLLSGDFVAAERLLAKESEPGFPTTPVRDDVSAVGMHRFLLRREQGRLREVEGDVRAAAVEFPWYPVHRAALVCLLCDLGRPEEALDVFRELAAGGFSTLVRDNEWLLTASLAAEGCVMLGDAAAARILYEQLAPFAGAHAIGHAEGSVGAVDRYLGLLADLLGNVEDAERHLADALAMNDQLGARPWSAHSQADLAGVLMRRGAAGDAARAEELRRSALATARELGMPALERRLVGSSADVGAPQGSGSMSSGMPRELTFVREGDFWVIGGDRVFRLKHAKGLAYLRVLIASPGREFHVLQLASGDAAVDLPRLGAGDDVTSGLRRDDAAGDAVLDSAAQAAYRDRLRELRPEIDAAEAAGDGERAARLQSEMDMIVSELSAAFGLGGRARKEGSVAERARQSVTKAIRDTLRRIRAEDPALGGHLVRAVRTGLYCAYDPDPAAAIRWRTDSTV